MPFDFDVPTKSNLQKLEERIANLAPQELK